jgi:hypothetical protein
MPFLPVTHRDYLTEKQIAYEEVEAGGQHGLICRGYPLPQGKYDIGSADALILIPPGYPDIPSDMFYLYPWVRLVPHNRYPTRADCAHQFAGRSWQRWSRHSSEWRPGVDGIWTLLKRMDHALRTAA